MSDKHVYEADLLYSSRLKLLKVYSTRTIQIWFTLFSTDNLPLIVQICRDELSVRCNL